MGKVLETESDRGGAGQCGKCLKTTQAAAQLWGWAGGSLPPGPSTSDPPFMHELLQALILERSRKTIHVQLPRFMDLKTTVV